MNQVFNYPLTAKVSVHDSVHEAELASIFARLVSEITHLADEAEATPDWNTLDFTIVSDEVSVETWADKEATTYRQHYAVLKVNAVAVEVS